MKNVITTESVEFSLQYICWMSLNNFLWDSIPYISNSIWKSWWLIANLFPGQIKKADIWLFFEQHGDSKYKCLVTDLESEKLCSKIVIKSCIIGHMRRFHTILFNELNGIKISSEQLQNHKGIVFKYFNVLYPFISILVKKKRSLTNHLIKAYVVCGCTGPGFANPGPFLNPGYVFEKL